MFRKPRDFDDSLSEAALTPSTGRPPTPPSSVTSRTISHGPIMTITSKSPLPSLGRSQTTPKNVSRQTVPLGKSRGKSNGSILSFFKKADASGKAARVEEEDLFFADTSTDREPPLQVPTPPREKVDADEDIYGESTSNRFNEVPGSVKRRRKESQSVGTVSVFEEVGSKDTVPHTSIDASSSLSPGQESNSGPKQVAGPFVEDSESEDEMIKHLSKAAFASVNPPTEIRNTVAEREDVENEDENIVPIPSLHRESTSIVGGDGFEGFEDFIDDEFPEDGEEHMERRWMDEQERLEMGLEELDGDENDLPLDTKEQETTQIEEEVGAESCPICSASLSGITAEVITIVFVDLITYRS